MMRLAQVSGTLISTLYRCRAGQSRATFEAWQSRKLDRWLQRDLPRVPFYAKAPTRLSDLPVIDKATVMGRFSDFNRRNITAAAGWRAFDGTGAIGDISIGASTGTSGNRSLYAFTDAERFRYLGNILAKTMPGFLFRKERIAVILPQSSALHDAANQTKRIELLFFDLRLGPEAWLDDLKVFAPTCIIAPPKILRYLAECAGDLFPSRLFSIAETLEPIDRQVIEATFGVILGQIYMATEGFFGVSCSRGVLHLAEDANFFEFEPVGDDLVSPLITGFQRQFQIMARYRMNDLLRLSPTPCPCGSPLRAVDEVVGRMDDVFMFQSNNQSVLITPDILRNVVLDTDRSIDDFRIQRVGEVLLKLKLPTAVAPPVARRARQALVDLLVTRGVEAEVVLVQETLPLLTSRKLRRVENMLRASQR